MTGALLSAPFAPTHPPTPKAMNDSSALRRRVLRYVIPVLVFSLAFNLSKFFESKVREEEEEEEAVEEDVEANSTHAVTGSQVRKRRCWEGGGDSTSPKLRKNLELAHLRNPEQCISPKKNYSWHISEKHGIFLKNTSFLHMVLSKQIFPCLSISKIKQCVSSVSFMCK